MRKIIATFIWDFSEYINIGLGRFAPIIFVWMIGSKCKKIK
jgi:hypothetical protein